MKLISFQRDGRDGLGAVVGGRVVDLAKAGNDALPDNMLAFLRLGDAGIANARKLIEDHPGDFGLDEVRLLAPVPNPSKVVAIGLNYMDHIRECGLEAPEIAIMFCKYPSAIIAHGDAIRWSAELTRQVDYEAELAVVIGNTARGVAAAEAFDYVAGYTICNDISARDLQFHSGDQWLRGKCLDTFCPLGPYLVTRDEIDDPHDLSIRCRLNGKIMQDSNTAEMLYKIPELIEYLSQAFTLLPGDIIATGTPHGVGAFRQPPVWLQAGDVVTVEIEGLGALDNSCVCD